MGSLNGSQQRRHEDSVGDTLDRVEERSMRLEPPEKDLTERVEGQGGGGTTRRALALEATAQWSPKGAGLLGYPPACQKGHGGPGWAGTVCREGGGTSGKVKVGRKSERRVGRAENGQGRCAGRAEGN